MKRILLSCGNDCKVHMLDVNTGSERATLEHDSKLWHMDQVSEDEFVSSGWDKKISYWDVKDRKITGTLDGHTSFTRAVKFLGQWGSPSDSDILLSSSFDQTIRIWKDKKCVSTLTGFHWAVNCLAVLPQSLPNHVFGGSCREMRCFDLEKGTLVRRILGEHTAMIQALDHDDHKDDPKGLLISGAEDEKVCLWDVRTFDCVNTIHQRSFVSSLFFWDAKNAVVVCAGDGSTTIWDLRKLTSDTPISSFIAAQEAIWSVVEIDGRRLAIASADCTTAMFEEDGKRKWQTRFEGRQFGLCFVGWQNRLRASLSTSLRGVGGTYSDPLLAFFSDLEGKGEGEEKDADADADAVEVIGDGSFSPSPSQDKLALRGPPTAAAAPGAAAAAAAAVAMKKRKSKGRIPKELLEFMRPRIVAVQLVNRVIHVFKIFLCESTNPALRDLRTASAIKVNLDLPNAYSDVLHTLITTGDVSVIQSHRWLLDYYMLFLALGHQKRAYLICQELKEIRQGEEKVLIEIAKDALKRCGRGFPLRKSADDQAEVSTTACGFTAAVFDEIVERRKKRGEDSPIADPEVLDYLGKHTIQGDNLKDHRDFAFRRFDRPKAFGGRVISLYRSLLRFRGAPPNVALRAKVDRTMFPAHLEILIQKSRIFGSKIRLDDIEHLSSTGEVWFRGLAGNSLRALIEFAYVGTISTHDITALIPLWKHSRDPEISGEGGKLLRAIETRLMEVNRDLLRVKQLEGALVNVASHLRDESVRHDGAKFFVEGSLFGGLSQQQYWTTVRQVVQDHQVDRHGRELRRMGQKMILMTAKNSHLQKEVDGLKEEVSELRKALMDVMARLETPD